MNKECSDKRTRKYEAGAGYAFAERDLLGFDLVQHPVRSAKRIILPPICLTDEIRGHSNFNSIQSTVKVIARQCNGEFVTRTC